MSLVESGRCPKRWGNEIEVGNPFGYGSEGGVGACFSVPDLPW